MANIKLSDAKMYIVKPDGNYAPIGPVEDFDCTYSDSILYVSYKSIRFI